MHRRHVVPDLTRRASSPKLLMAKVLSITQRSRKHAQALEVIVDLVIEGLDKTDAKKKRRHPPDDRDTDRLTA